jgi:tripartite ATP-independent transporter DctP family solute receptor
VPEADLFNFPFLFRDLDHFYKVVDGPVGDQIARKIEESLDCLVLGWWFSGARNVWNSKRPIYKPEDLNGLKIRVIASPVILESFDVFGAQSTSMSFGELYSAVQQGVLDGAECDLTDIHGMKFYEVTKYVSSTEHLFLAVALLYSKKQYDLLPPEVQKAVRKAGKNSEKIQREAMELKTQESLIELENLGLIFNKVDKKPFQVLAWEIYKKNAEKVGGMALIEDILSQ